MGSASNGTLWRTTWLMDGGSQNVCTGGFAGMVSGTRYNLGRGECVTVDVGDLLFDNGASTNCPNALQCGTTYVFRSYALAPNVLNVSAYTANLQCSTSSCGSGGGCTLTQGYWRTHNPIVCITDPNSPLCIQWPVSSLTLGTNVYTVSQLVDILNTPAAGNGLISLAHQLIAADLNIANGADGSSIQSAIDAANTMIGSLVVPPVGSDSLPPSVVSDLVTALDNYNSGLTGPGHCSNGE